MTTRLMSAIASLTSALRKSVDRDAAAFQRCREHVLGRILETDVGQAPFHHMFIERIFPEELYVAMKKRMLHYKYGEKLQDRPQDSQLFVNKRYSLVESKDPEIRLIRSIFSDPGVKAALLSKFYLDPTRELSDSLAIHEEFEFTFTTAGRFQNIHIDIPPKFMSFVFYFPEGNVTEAEEERNATVLYDKDLRSRYCAKYRANSVCVFVPHFYSYHGFASTIDREVLVMFYVNALEMTKWSTARMKDEPPFSSLKNAIEEKLIAHPLIEYGRDRSRIAGEREACLVNAPKGRVMRDTSGDQKAG